MGARKGREGRQQLHAQRELAFPLVHCFKAMHRARGNLTIIWCKIHPFAIFSIIYHKALDIWGEWVYGVGVIDFLEFGLWIKIPFFIVKSRLSYRITTDDKVFYFKRSP